VIEFKFHELDFNLKTTGESYTYITSQQIDKLNNQSRSEITIILKSKKCSNGWTTDIIDNNTGVKLELSDLSLAAYSYYIQKVEELSLQKALEQLRTKQIITA